MHGPLPPSKSATGATEKILQGEEGAISLNMALDRLLSIVVKSTFLGLETKTETLDFRSRDRDLGLQFSRPKPGQNELECTRVSRPWSRDHNTGCINSNWWQSIRLKAVVKVVLWSRGGAHLTKPGWSKPHTHSNSTNLALFRHKITPYRLNQGAQMGAGGWAPSL